MRAKQGLRPHVDGTATPGSLTFLAGRNIAAVAQIQLGQAHTVGVQIKEAITIDRYGRAQMPPTWSNRAKVTGPAGPDR